MSNLFIKIEGGISMEEKLLKIFKLADSLNEKQDKVYAKIIYTADDNKIIELEVLSKDDNSYVESCKCSLHQNPLIKWDNFISLLESYIESATK